MAAAIQKRDGVIVKFIFLFIKTDNAARLQISQQFKTLVGFNIVKINDRVKSCRAQRI